MRLAARNLPSPSERGVEGSTSPCPAGMGRDRPAIRLGGCLLGMVLVSLVGCGKHGTPAPKGGSLVAPAKVVLERNVELAIAEQRPLVAKIETVGVLEAEGQTDIAAGVNGVVDEVLFREGDEVTPGTILVKIDQVRYETEERLAEANVQRAKAAVDLARDLAERAERAGRGASEEDRAKTRGQLRVTEAEYLSSMAVLERARHNLQRSRVRAPFAGRINRRMVYQGSYLEEKTIIATMADLARIRLVAFVPETAAPTIRELLRHQSHRLEIHRRTLPLCGLGSAATVWSSLVGMVLVGKDYVPSGYDPEFDVLAIPGVNFLARIFYMSTVGQTETHMFETKGEVLGWTPELAAPLVKHLRSLPRDRLAAARTALLTGGWLAESRPWSGFAALQVKRQADHPPPFQLWPGFTAKIRFPLRTNPRACVIPEEAVRASERGFIAFVPYQQTREDGQVEWIAKARILDLGFRAEGWVEVRQGLSQGEWIVRRGAEALEDGTPIRFSKIPL